MEIVLLAVILGLYILEFIEKKKLQKKIDELNKINSKKEAPKPQLTEKEKQKQEKLRESFNNMMEYGYETALKGKKE
jgi:uncharacterized protein YnzC (UPF0291/DUF896 family)